MNRRIDRLQRRAAETRGLINLGGGLPAEAQFPRRALTRAFLETLGRPGAPGLQYGWPEGLAGLRAWVAETLRARGASVGEEDVMITNGAQQALAIATELTCREGARVAVDPETYPAALELFRTRGLVPVAPLEAPAAAAYAMPEVNNPRGQRLDAEVRQRLLAHRRPILEDDAYADLRFAGPAGRPLLADAPERVFHIGTFSKTLSPGLRVGWLVAPPRLRRRALRLKQSSDLQPSSLAQEIVQAYLGRVDFTRRLTTLRRFYRRRAERLTEALARHLPAWRFHPPAGGFAVWAELDQDHDEVALLEQANAEGVSFDPGSLFRPTGKPRPAALRLAFSAAAEEDLAEGVCRLSRAWAKAHRRRRR